MEMLKTPCWSAAVTIQLFTGDLKISAGKYKKVKLIGAIRFSTGELTKIYVQKMQKFHKTCCYLLLPKSKTQKKHLII